MRRLLLSLVPSLVVGSGAAVAGFTDTWTRLGVPVGASNFGDLNVILVAAQCAHDDPAWSAATPPCVAGMDYYNYPSLWAKAFGIFGANPSWTSSVAVALTVLFVVALFPLTWYALGTRPTWGRTLVMTLVAVLPPTWLAFQRGNIDQGVFALIVLSAVLWISGLAVAPGIAVGVAATLKIFPIGSALMLLNRSSGRRSALVSLISTGIVGILLIARDLPTISARTPQIDGASFGIGLLPLLAANRLNLAAGVTTARLVGAAVFIAVTVLLIIMIRSTAASTPTRAWRELCEGLSADHVASSLVLAGGGAFLVAYLLGPSYDYRLIFLLPVIAGLLRLASRAANVAVSILIAQFLLSYSTYVGAAEYLSDLMLLVVAPLMLITAWFVVRPSRRMVTA